MGWRIQLQAGIPDRAIRARKLPAAQDLRGVVCDFIWKSTVIRLAHALHWKSEPAECLPRITIN
jgi:hypothetical protein